MAKADPVTVKPPHVVPFAAPYFGDEERRALGDVLTSGWVGTGPQAREAEREFTRYLHLPYALLVNSGTAALHLALLVLGVEAGDEVIVPTITFTATAATVVHAGAVPIFVDVEPDTLNIDIQRARDAITPRTRAVVAVHIAGRMADVIALRRLSDERGLAMIEDSAHALPAARDGLGPGQAADAAAFSFFVTKPLTSVEGGLLATTDKVALERARILSAQGIERQAPERGFSQSPHYDVVAAGFKYNLPDLLVALLRCQLHRADWMHERRRAIAEAYLAGLSDLPEFEMPPADQPHNSSSWYLFIIRMPKALDRDLFAQRLALRGVGTSVHFRPLHQFSYYARYYPTAPANVEVADGAYRRVLSLPIYAGMSDLDVEYVIEAVHEVANEVS